MSSSIQTVHDSAFRAVVALQGVFTGRIEQEAAEDAGAKDTGSVFLDACSPKPCSEKPRMDAKGRELRSGQAPSKRIVAWCLSQNQDLCPAQIRVRSRSFAVQFIPTFGAHVIIRRAYSSPRRGSRSRTGAWRAEEPVPGDHGRGSRTQRGSRLGTFLLPACATRPVPSRG